MTQTWSRFIRFVATETGQVHYGQPAGEQLDVGIAAWNKQTIKAYEISGSPLNQTARVTNNMLTVKELLAPIPREEIRTVRCLGLNYVDHAQRLTWIYLKSLRCS